MNKEIKKLIESENLLERFENGEFALIEKVQATPQMVSNGISDKDFEAIVVTNLNRILMMREHNPERPPPNGGLMLIRKHRWQMMKDRKELFLNLMDQQNIIKRKQI